MSRSEDKIVKAFNDLLLKKPFNKITVKDIVEESGVHRNTFYYHYQDIPSLLQYFVQSKIDVYRADPRTEDTLLESMRPMVADMQENKKVLMNLYTSVEKEMLMRGIRSTCTWFVDRQIDERVKQGLVAPEDRDLMAKFQAAMAAGVVIDWMECQMEYDLIEEVSRFNELFVKEICKRESLGEFE